MQLMEWTYLIIMSDTRSGIRSVLPLFLPCWWQLRKYECCRTAKSLSLFFNPKTVQSCRCLQQVIREVLHATHRWTKRLTDRSHRRLFSLLSVGFSLGSKSLYGPRQCSPNLPCVQKRRIHLHRIIILLSLLFCWEGAALHQTQLKCLFRKFFWQFWKR